MGALNHTKRNPYSLLMCRFTHPWPRDPDRCRISLLPVFGTWTWVFRRGSSIKISPSGRCEVFADLLGSMLRYRPEDRTSAEEALRHEWFTM